MSSSILHPFYSGKVRELYKVDDHSMLMLTSDKVSAFDKIFEEKIENKGILLNQISNLWIQAIKDAKLPEKHNFELSLITDDINFFPEPYKSWKSCSKRSSYVKQVERINLECIVRGHAAGSFLKGSNSFRIGEKLESPYFNPTSKAELGQNDEEVAWEYVQDTLGKELSIKLKNISLALYNFAYQKMQKIGIILVDTKFEFGLIRKLDSKSHSEEPNRNTNWDKENKVFLIDEVLTPDSSRYWDKKHFILGEKKSIISYDKQIIRDYVKSKNWNKNEKLPPLDTAIIKKTQERYMYIYNKIQEALK